MVNAHPEETYDALCKSDEQLKAQASALAKYRKLPDEATIAKTKAALESKKFNVVVVNTGAEACEWLKKTIPAGKTVGNSHSTTLEEIGFIEHLKTQTAWDNLHSKVFSESDPAKQAQRYKDMHNAEYYISSASAVSTTGEITAADLTGTKVGAFSYGAGNLILVVGAQKIVPDYAAAVERTEKFALAAESARVRLAYKIPGSSVNNFVAIKGPNPFSPATRVHVVIVKELLGY